MSDLLLIILIILLLGGGGWGYHGGYFAGSGSILGILILCLVIYLILTLFRGRPRP